jgi:DNA-binding CsgD family transcriptional regulator
MTLLDRNPAALLSDLTAKQTEVLDLLLQHKTTKQIARELNIAPNTVDSRIEKVREKWGTSDRKATARVYAHLRETCEKPPCGFSPLATDILRGHGFNPDLPGSSIFSVSDAHTFEHLAGLNGKRTGLEALDAKFGKLGRVGAIVVLAMFLAITLVASLAIATALGRFI